MPPFILTESAPDAKKSVRAATRMTEGISTIALANRRCHLSTYQKKTIKTFQLSGDFIAYASPDSNKGRLTFATANVLAVTALDALCAQRLSADPEGERTLRGNIPVNKSIVINAPAEELYQFWRDLENLPRFMRYLESVKETGEGRSHWVAKAPGGSVEWDAEITEDRPNQLIAWRSLEGSEVDNSGTVRFEQAAGGRGTVIHVELDYNPPGGSAGALVAKLLGEDPEGQMQTDLRRFKQVIELGEVVVSDGTLLGEGYSEQRPAQPLGVGLGGQQQQQQ